jgi:glutamate-1-semialdehyde 2,1-aminomutase
MTAGLVVLEELEKGQVLPHVNHMTDLLVKGLREAGERKGLPILVNSIASILQVHFGPKNIRNKRDALKVDRAASMDFHFGMRANGVMASYHPLFLSAAHTESHIQKVLEVADAVMEQMKEALPIKGLA